MAWQPHFAALELLQMSFCISLNSWLQVLLTHRHDAQVAEHTATIAQLEDNNDDSMQVQVLPQPKPACA